MTDQAERGAPRTRQVAGSSTLTPDGHVAEWFAVLLFEAAEAAGTKITEARVRIYAAELGDLAPAEIVAAVRRLRREGSGFFPQIVEIRRAILGSPDDAAILAWTGLEHAATAIGAWQPCLIDDPAAALAVQRVFGSWPALCGTERGPAWLVKRQEFLAAYRDARRMEAAAPAPVRFAGLVGETPTARAWAGRLLIDGRVEYVADVQALPGTPDVKHLTNGTREDTHGQESEGEEAPEGAGRKRGATAR